MSDYRIIFTNADGGVSIIIPAPGVAEEQAAAAVPDGVPYEVVSVSALPQDRTFRNAWERNGQTVEHNMAKAREIAHDKRRAARAAEFAPLDVEATIPAKAADAEIKRQAVRDKYASVQIDIDEAVDVDALRSVLQQL